MGTVFIALLVFLTIPFCLVCSRPCRNCTKWFSKILSSWGKSFRGNVYFRFIMEGFLDIGICASLNVIFLLENDLGLEWDTLFMVMNNVTLILLITTVILFPIVVSCFYLKTYSRW